MQEILISTSVGGFDLSKDFFDRLLELNCEGASEELEIIEYVKDSFIKDGEQPPRDFFPASYIKRDNPLLIRVFKEFENIPKSINTEYSKLKLIEIPEGIDWYIYTSEDGRESVHEKHRTWE